MNDAIDPFNIKANGGVNKGTRHALRHILENAPQCCDMKNEQEHAMHYIRQLDILTSKLRRIVGENLK